MKTTNPPTSTTRSMGTPSPGSTCGSTAVRKKSWFDTASTSATGTTRSSGRTGAGIARGRSSVAGRRTPQWPNAADPSRMTPPITNDGRNPSRAATAAPPSGPNTCPSVIGELHGRHVPAHVSRIVLPARHDERERGRGAHRAQHQARAEELRERVGERHPHEGDALEQLDPDVLRAGIAAVADPAPRGLVTTVTSEEIPRIQPAQRSVVAGSWGLIAWT